MPTSHETRTARGLSVSKRAFSVPATDLADAVRLCDPFTPLDPREDAVLHEDLSSIRGGDRLGKIVRNVRRAGGTPTLHFVSGHLGSGKTTELLRMKERLETTEGDAPLITTLFLDADTMLDRNDVDLEDILIALWGLVYEVRPAAAAKVLTPVWKSQISSGLSKFAISPDVPEALKKLPGDNMGSVHAGLGDMKHALEYEQALSVQRDVGDRAGEGITFNDIGEAHFKLGDTKRALEYYERALPILRDVGYRAGEATVLFNLGNVAEKNGDIVAAIDLVTQAVKIDEAIESPELAERRAHLEALHAKQQSPAIPLAAPASPTVLVPTAPPPPSGTDTR
jgi:hypothetical protein